MAIIEHLTLKITANLTSSDASASSKLSIDILPSMEIIIQISNAKNKIKGIVDMYFKLFMAIPT